MKKILTLSFVISLSLTVLPHLQVSGAYLKDVPYTVTQPDGQEISCFLTGDEYYTFLHDAAGYTIVRDPVSGYYVYAALSGDEPVPTSHVVGRVSPAVAGLSPGANISPARWKQLREDFWKDAPGKENQPGFKGNLSEASGAINNLVVYIRFSDQTDFLQGIPYYDLMFNNTSAGSSSLKNYFLEASYNAVNITSSFYPEPVGNLVLSYQDPFPRSYYMPFDAATNPGGYTSSDRTAREHTLLANAVSAIASQVPAGLNIDYNNDNKVDNVCFIIRGGTTAWSTLLWPHRWSLYSQYVYLQGNKRVYDFNFQLETFLDSYSVGVLAHEMFHTLGAPDLYHYTSNGIDPVGSWDLMCSNTNPPQHMSAYMKYKYGGWISSIPVISNPGTYTLNSLLNSSGNCFRINSPNSASEYFVVEYRKKTGTFEGKVPGSGLVVYRINPAVTGNAGGPPDEVYVFRPNGTPTVNGSVSSAYFSAESGRTAFDNTTNPYCFLSSGAFGDIYLSNIGSSAGTSISFTLASNVTASFTATPTSICPGETVTFSDQSTGSPTSWSWDFGDGSASTDQHPSHQYVTAGTYTVSLTVANALGSHTAVLQDYIQVLAAPAVSVGITADPAGTVCPGQLVTFTAIPVNGGASPVYQWFVNESAAGGNNDVFTFEPADGDQVYCVLTGSLACPAGTGVSSNVLTMTVATGGIPAQPVFVTAADVVCRNQTGVVYAVAPLAGVTSYLWSISAGASIISGQGTSSVSVNFSPSASSGVISVFAIGTCGNGPAANFSYTVATVKPLTPGSITGPTSVPAGSTAVYTIIPVANATGYIWTAPANASILSGQGTTSVTLGFSSSWNGGTLSVKATNCVGTSKARTLKIRKLNRKEQPTAPLPGTVVQDLASREIPDVSLLLFPNPASGKLVISTESDVEGPAVLRFFNLTGQLVFRQDLVLVEGRNDLGISIQEVPEGWYLVCLDRPGLQQRSRLVVTR